MQNIETCALRQGGLTSSAEPLVSVNMLAYNHGPYIRRAIEGVLRQETAFPFELIIGEDCSTDNTREIACGFQRSHPTIVRVVTSEKNVGVKANIRRTIAACRGRFIAYCEGDDYWHDTSKLQRQVAFLEANADYALVHSNYRTYHVESGRMAPRSLGLRLDLDDGSAFNDILSGQRIILTLTVCLRKAVMDLVLRECPECFDPRFLMGDTQLWLEMARRGKVKYLPDVLATYQVLPESATQSRDPARVLRFALSAKDVLDHYIEKYGCSAEARIAAKTRSAFHLLRCAYRAGDVQVAIDALREYRRLAARIPLEGRFCYWGSRSPKSKALIDPVLTIMRLWKKCWRRLGRLVGPK
jgi:glycosyltransferase involved in cell wall biosynthesis